MALKPDSRSTVFRGARVIDGSGAAPRHTDVKIAEGRIVELGNSLTGDELLDAGGHVLMPGLIDCHIHCMVESFDLLELIETPFSLSFYLAAMNLEKTLKAGITSARDLGGADLGVREAVTRGLIQGPDLQIAINIISMTGGHGDHWSVCGFELPDLLTHPGRPNAICDGEADAIRVAREMLRAGADFLKICTTGGLLSPRDTPFSTQFLPKELEAITAVARDAGTHVVAHAQSPEGIQRAIRAGVKTIEHGFYLDQETVQMMVERDVFLVPTLMAPHGVLQAGEGRRSAEVEQARAAADAHQDSVALAIRAGVKIAMGTDAGAVPHGHNREEILRLATAGMTPLAAITAATAVSSQAMGIDADRGTIEVGKRADLLLSEIDPLNDLEAFCSADFQPVVWKSGQRVL